MYIYKEVLFWGFLLKLTDVAQYVLPVSRFLRGQL